MRDDFSPGTKDLLAKRVGYRCSNPSCRQLTSGPNGDAKKSVNIGVAAHIIAASPGGPRYDASFTAEARKSQENGIWLCQNCAKLVDSDLEKYTVKQLLEWKQKSEEQAARELEGGTDGESYSEGTYKNVVTNGSIINTHNQKGGQNAHIINNYGPPSRKISPLEKHQMLAILGQAVPGEIGFASTLGDYEAHEFKAQLMEVFKEAGWIVHDLRTFMFFSVHKGLKVTIPSNVSENGLPQLVAYALEQTNNPIDCNRGDMANSCGIYVQVWAAP